MPWTIKTRNEYLRGSLGVTNINEEIRERENRLKRDVKRKNNDVVVEKISLLRARGNSGREVS